MGSKYKSWEKPRNVFALLAKMGKGGYMRHRNERRAKENDDVRVYVSEWEDCDYQEVNEYYDCE